MEGLNMDRAIVIGVLSMFVVWVGAVTFASAKLLWTNWRLFLGWHRQDRDTSMRLTLWLAVPLMKVGILLFAVHALWNLVFGYRASSEMMLFRALVVLPFVMASIILQLRWMADRAYGDTGDRFWQWLLIVGAMLGGVMFAVTWWV
jgi:hypothetical protein